MISLRRHKRQNRHGLLQLYVTKRVLQPFVMLLGVLLLALVMERMLRLVQIVTNHGAPIQTVLEMVIYLLPHYLGLAIPAALFLAVMLGFRSLIEHSELVVIRNFGIPLKEIFKPMILLGVLMSFLMLIITGYLQPHSRHAYRATTHQLKTQDVLTNLKPGIFQDIGNDITLRADQVLSDGKILKGFFASKTEADGSRLIFTAQQAEIRPALSLEENKSEEQEEADFYKQLQPDKEDKYEIVLFLTNGVLMQDRPGKAASELNFEQYPWVVSLKDSLKPYGPRGRDERELTIAELMNGIDGNKKTQASPVEIKTEMHVRIIQCLSLIPLVILAVPLSLLGRGRAGKAYGILLGIVIVVLYEKIIGFGEAYAAAGHISPLLALWTPLIAMTLFAGWLYDKLSGDHYYTFIERCIIWVYRRWRRFQRWRSA